MIIHYKKLEITEKSSLDEIKIQYRKLSKIYHPDISKDDGSKFRELTESYEWLLKNHKQKIDNEPSKEYSKSLKEFKFITISKYYNNYVRVRKQILKEGGVVMIIDPSNISIPEFRIVVPKGCKEGSISKVDGYTFIIQIEPSIEELLKGSK